MRLEASCHCGAVRFSVISRTPQPYMHCHCTICRKTAGGGGYAINLMGEAETLEVEGAEHISVYQVRGTAEDPQALSPMRRHFCKHCGSALYVFDPNWPDLVHPFASALDTPLPVPPERAHIMLDFKAPWVEVPEGVDHKHFNDLPDQSIEDWHKSRGLHES